MGGAGGKQRRTPSRWVVACPAAETQNKAIARRIPMVTLLLSLDLGARRLGHAEDFQNLSPSFGLVGVIGSRSGTACENMNHRRRDAR